MNRYLLAIMLTAAVLGGCRTSASFMLPPDTDLVIDNERVPLTVKDEAGRVAYERTPFFWNSVVGIEYVLLQNGKTIKKDRLPSFFRVASIFWPPYALIYWPIGFGYECYDLTDPKKEFIDKCPMPDNAPKAQTTSAKTVQ